MTERLTDEALDHGAGGSISTARFEAVRYWLGHETGDVFGPDCDYDGPTLTIEVADAADAQAMLAAISGDAFRRGVAVGWAERLKQDADADVAAHRRAQSAPAPVAWFWERGGDLELTLLKDGEYGKRLAGQGFIAHPLYRAPASDALREENDRLRSALADLVSWFDSGPSPYGPWIIVAGEQGADEAVEAAFAALSQPAPAPQAADDLRAAAVKAAVAEYDLKPALDDGEDMLGRRCAVRGMMVRLGLYAQFNAALSQNGGAA